MDQQKKTIKCPNCGHEIDVNDILYHQVDEELKQKYNDELAREKRVLEARLDSLNDERSALEKAKRNQHEAISKAVHDELKTEKKRLQTELRITLEAEQAERITMLRDELNQKSSQLKEFNKAKSEIEKLKREKDEMRDALEAESQKKLNETLLKEKEKIRKTEEDKTKLKLSEREHVIKQLQHQLSEAQRKAEQGSMQIQGEVQELAIEEWLRQEFPLDSISEIKKGSRGADCVQTVNTRSASGCGSIYYESKRTKSFQPGWIEKFREDIRDKGADIGVLITQAMPNEMQRMGMRDGIWICTFEEFKGLSHVLRESLIQLHGAVLAQDNKGDKMSMLYDFLTGNEFRQQVEAIVEGFTQMQTDLDAEKRAMLGIWKKREKQIQKVLLNTNHMYSSVKGIAGTAIQSVPLLELPTDND